MSQISAAKAVSHVMSVCVGECNMSCRFVFDSLIFHVIVQGIITCCVSITLKESDRSCIV